jgi:vancomycin permeability regulator SanA
MHRTVTNTSNDRTNARIILTLLILLSADLLFLYYVKYTNRHMHLSEFSFDNAGNILNLVFALIPLLSLPFLQIKRSKVENKKYWALQAVALFMTACLIAAFLSERYELGLPNIYFQGFPLKKIFTGLLYVSFQVFQFYLSILCWILVFKNKHSVYFFSMILSVFGIFVLLSFSFFNSLDYQDQEAKYFDQGNKADLTVVLGAAVWSKNKPSTILAARIAKTSNLYAVGISKKILVTGGNAPGELTESQVARNYLIRYGVDKEDIIIEKKTSSTSEQIEFIKDSLLQKHNYDNIIIVSDNFHLKRILEICRFYNVHADGIASGLRLNFPELIYYRIRESIGLLLFWLFGI